MRNKKWVEYLLALEKQKEKSISPGWQGYRRRYKEGGEVSANPIDGLRDYILSEIDGMKFNFAGKIAKGSIIKAVNKSFADLGTNPSREQVENLWLEQSANLDNLNKILKNPDNQAGIKERITETYNKAYDSQFNLDIPTTEATKLAETGAVAAGGGFLRPLLSAGTQGASKATPLLSAFVPGTAQAPTTTEMYGVEFGTPEYYSAGVSFNGSLLSNKKDRREDRINRTNKMEELRAKNAQAVAQAKARDEAKAKQEAQEKQKEQKQKVQKQKEKTYSNVTVDNKGSKGYTGQGSQSRAGNRVSKPPSQPKRSGVTSSNPRKNYLGNKRVTGGR
jgi:hypothetical protein